jgi:hypothetical protein
MIAEATKVCKDCGKELPLSAFYRNPKSLLGVHSYCKSCHDKRQAAYRLKRRDYYLEYNKQWNRRHRAERPEVILFKSTKERATKAKLPFTLTLEWFKNKTAFGKCELTGVVFDYGKRSLRRPSPDRIDNTLGYTEDNTRLICWGLNAM